MKKSAGSAKNAAKINIDSIHGESLSRLMQKLYDYISSFDPNDENTLQIAISALLKNKTIEQITLADVLGQSRTQISRWAKGTHIPRNPAFRGWLVGELLQFMREKAGISCTPPTPPRLPANSGDHPKVPAPS
jgi:hypothetical protein